MSETIGSLRRKIGGAEDLHSVVRTMKALAASSVGQYERSLDALGDYYGSVELGLGLCFRQSEYGGYLEEKPKGGGVGAIVFGSDQGLVGQFNEVIVDFAIERLSEMEGEPQIWVVGERAYARLMDAGLSVRGLYKVPTSVKAIAPLVAEIETQSEAFELKSHHSVYILHNRPLTGSLYEPVIHRLLPLDAEWHQTKARVAWPGKNLPEVLGDLDGTMRALIREFLFITLYRACAQSLAAENASRLAAMDRADQNIGELLEELQGTFHRLRQDSIDEELFDVISGYEALSK